MMRKQQRLVALGLVAALVAVVMASPLVQANPAQVPLALYYDYFADRDPDLNAELVMDGLETAFGGNDGNEPIKIGDAKTSMRMSPDEFTTDNVLANLAVYDYVHVDEMNNEQTVCAEDCATVVREVAEAGYGARIIFFFRFSYTGAGLDTQKDLLQAGLDGYLRKIFFEVYDGDYIYTSNVDTAASKLQQWSDSYAAVLQGSNILVAPAVGLRNGDYENPYLDICAQDLDALYDIFADMHQIQVDWKGAAFYGASETMDCASDYTVPDLVDKCASLTSWWVGK